MRYYHQLIIGISLFCSSLAHAVDFYADALYWQASETVDWALTNNRSVPNHIISYKTIDFNFAPGFRVGAGFQNKDWNSRFLYTRYNVRANASTQGNVVSAFMASKFISLFYNTAQVDFSIDFNTFDADLYKTIHVGDSLILNPIIGLRGGWINQTVKASYQTSFNVVETTTNNFSGFGPKVGIDSRWDFYKKNDYQYSLLADFSGSFMWGKWSINDVLTQSNSLQLSYVNVGKRDFGALAVQVFIGINLDYKNYALKFGYEVADWFNQYQAFDNATGGHSNDLILQGLTVGFNYHW